jgi:hypothetical protein
MKIALYKSMNYGSIIVSEYRGEEKPWSTYVRISEPVEVEFPPLVASTDSQIKALEEEREAIVTANKARLADIDSRKAVLEAAMHKEDIKPSDPIGDKLRSLPVIGVLNVDNPRDPRHGEWML